MQKNWKKLNKMVESEKNTIVEARDVTCVSCSKKRKMKTSRVNAQSLVSFSFGIRQQASSGEETLANLEIAVAASVRNVASKLCWKKEAFLLSLKSQISQIELQITFVLIRCIASNSGLQFVDFLALLASLNPFCNQVRKQFFHNFEVRSQGKFVRKLELITCVTTFLSLQCGWSFTDCFLKHRWRYYLDKKK